MLTSEDIGNFIDRFSTIFATKQDLQKVKDDLQEDMRDLRLDVLDKFDAVYKEVKDMRLEQNAHVQTHRDIDERLDKLESVSSSQPA